MLSVLFEDQSIIVVEKPSGLESQVSRGFGADMVSEIRKHIHKLSPGECELYVGVIHRLDKPVQGVMVYAKTKKAAALLSKQVQDGDMKKIYYAVVCGKPVDNVGNYVDYLLKDEKNNHTKIVDKGLNGAKRAELRYYLKKTVVSEGSEYSLLEIELLTGRHHQIRVQMAGHGTPILGDTKYGKKEDGLRRELCLCASSLSFTHPDTGKRMTFSIKPKGRSFRLFEIEEEGEMQK